MKVWLLVVPLILLTAACSTRTVEYSGPQKPPVADQPTAATAHELTPVEDGREIFLANCSNCHGKNADSDTPSGRAWKVPNLHSAQVQSLSDEQLLQIIRQGKGRMPPWNTQLGSADLAHVLVYVRTLRTR